MIKRAISFLICLLLLTGCALPSAVLPLNTTPLSPKTATLVFYTEEMLGGGDVFLDREKVGEMKSSTPLQMEVEPGEHIIWVKQPMTIARPMTIEVSPNKIYFYKTMYISGAWASSLFIMQVPPVSSFVAAISYPEAREMKRKKAETESPK